MDRKKLPTSFFALLELAWVQLQAGAACAAAEMETGTGVDTVVTVPTGPANLRVLEHSSTTRSKLTGARRLTAREKYPFR